MLCYGDVYHQQLAWAGQDVDGESDPAKAKRDTPLGNLFTDAYRALTGTDVAFEASGFLRDALSRGPIVGADVFRAMPCGLPAGAIVRPYRLVTFRTTGAGLIAVLQATIDFDPNYFPQMSGMRLKYDSRLEPGSPVLVDSVRVGDEKLEAERLYSVTVTEGVYSVVRNLMPWQDRVTLNTLAFDAARPSFVVEPGELGPTVSNRIQDIGAISGKGRSTTAFARADCGVRPERRCPVRAGHRGPRYGISSSTAASCRVASDSVNCTPKPCTRSR